MDRFDTRAGGSAEDRDPLDKDRAPETGARGVRNSVRRLASSGVRAFARSAIELAAIGLAYFVFAKVGLALASINPSATPIWPPTGLALAAIILWGYRVWPAIFLAALIANVTTAGSIYTSLAIALGNTLECLVGGYLVHRWSEGTDTFETPAGVTRFALISLIAATPISATIGVGSLHLAGYADAAHLASIWMTWWLGDVAGALVIAPVVVLWARSSRRSFDRHRLLETCAVLAGACAVGVIAFSPLVEQTANRDPLGFLAVVPLIWAALRGGPRDTATVALILSVFAVWGTVAKGGPFARMTLNESFLVLLMFMISISVPSLVLSAEVAVRKRTEQRLKLLAAEVDHRARNVLAVAQGLVRLTRAATVEAFATAVTGRINALARAHALLSQSRWEGVDLNGLVKEELAPYRAGDASRVQARGPATVLGPVAAQAFAMAVHELVTNAAKYGALSVPQGRVMVEWETGANKSIELRWTETGGPAVTRPNRKGLGTAVVERTVCDQLGGVVRFDWRVDGLVCQITVPSHALARAQPLVVPRI